MRKFLPTMLLLSFTFFATAQEFKTVGYLPHYKFGYLQDINFSQVTHVNISFANPDMDGNITLGDGKDIDEAVNLIHAAGAQAYIALAGGFLLPEWEAAWEHNMVAERRSEFINKIMDYVRNENLDGVDMDLEWSHVNELYSPFVMELADSLDAHDLTFTAALPGTYRYPEISDEALGVFEWINIMAYDLRGGWNPSDAGPHSPYSFAVSSINHWRTQGIESERLTLGVPFYGYDFSDPTKTVSMTFDQIVNLDEDNAYADSAGNVYYNGIPTIVKKTELAMAELSGVMIWELGQDNFGEYSLLSTIYNTINGGASSVSTHAISNYFRATPNPFDDNIRIKLDKSSAHVRVQIINVNGALLRTEISENTDLINIETGDFVSGTYVLQVTTNDGHFSKLVVK